jgi:AsmA protein
MKQKRIWIVLAGLAIMLLIGIFVVQHFLDADTYRGRIEAALSDALGRPVQLGHLSFSLFTGSLVAEALSIADDPSFGTQPFLTAKDVKIGVEISPLLFHRELHITGFTIDEPQITLLRAENGTWNYSSLGGSGKPKTPGTSNPIPDLTVAKFDIKKGTLTIGALSQPRKARVYSYLDVDAQNCSLATAFPFTLSGKLPAGGFLDASGTAGPLNQRDASLTPVTAQVSLRHADLVGAGLVEPEQGISGIADLDTKVVSNGQSANAAGTLHCTQLKLARNGSPSSHPVDLQFAVVQDLRALSGKIENANLRIGNAALAIAGSYQTRGNAMTTALRVNGPNLPIDDLVAFLPSLGVILPPGSRLQGGTLSTTLNVTGPVTAPVVNGPVKIANTQLAGFNLGQKLGSIRALTGAQTGSDTTIQVLSTDLRYGPDGTNTDNLMTVVSGLGSASGSGYISPTGALNYHLLFKLDSSGIGGIATQAMSALPGVFGSTAGQAAKNGIPVNVGGTTSSPTFVPDLSRLAGTNQSQSPTKTSPANPLSNAISGLFGKH